ncbi:unnamed protein product [Blepharisma stoltei]|uniref:Uncharacterized protein n=1 Tax=Blepharisma stoltei TaxID=1481888 RepID=A0AAU9IZD1_9CILI|nr:unnamed protein product [Blepharisma stoltei]
MEKPIFIPAWYKVIPGIFIFLLFLIFALMFWALFSPQWVTLKYTRYEDMQWTGSISHVIEGLGNLEGATYGDLTEAYCATTDRTQDIPTQENTWCYMFLLLWIGEAVYVVFSILSMMSLLLWIIYNFRDIKIGNFQSMKRFCYLHLAWMCYDVGFIAWMILTRTNFNDDCHKERDHKHRPKLCGLAGPTLGAILMFAMPIILVGVTYVLRKISVYINPQRKLEIYEEKEYRFSGGFESI